MMTKSIGWGLVGASAVARDWVIDAIRAQPGNQILNVLSSDARRGAAFAEANGIPASTTSLDDLLANPAIGAVYISTANDLHRDQVIAAARAGKHVLCEKPLALDVADAQAMVRACREAGVVMATNHHLRCSALHMALRDQIHAGGIGRLNAVRVFHANFLAPGSAPAHGNWRLNGAGAGVLLDSTIHDIDTLRFLIGADPVAVFAMGQYGRAAGEGIEDGVMAILRFPGQILVQIHGAYTVPNAPGGIEFYGDAGALIGRNCMSPRPEGTLHLRQDGQERELPIHHHNLYHQALQCFCRAVAGDGQPAATGEDGLASLTIALALRESLRTGRQIEVNLS